MTVHCSNIVDPHVPLRQSLIHTAFTFHTLSSGTVPDVKFMTMHCSSIVDPHFRLGQSLIHTVLTEKKPCYLGQSRMLKNDGAL